MAVAGVCRWHESEDATEIMRVTFVLPGASCLPAGGPRMVFRYANALADVGWRVSVVMPVSLKAASPGWRLLRMGRYWLLKFTQGYSPQTWMRLHPAVRLFWWPDLAVHRAIEGDVVIATAVQTAEAIAQWPASAGRKYYFVQGYETWDHSAARIEASWRLPFSKIAVSRWLGELIASTGEAFQLLTNGLDHEAFGLDRPPENRSKSILLWPHHHLTGKGSADVTAAIRDMGAEGTALELRAYGTTAAPRVEGLRITYFRNPAQAELRQLYNQATVMVAPSHSEGWGLPACEALQCGCALAASDIGGHREFLKHERNSLLYPPGNVVRLRENICRLMAGPTLRLRLARQGLVDMAALRFEPTVARLQEILQEKN